MIAIDTERPSRYTATLVPSLFVTVAFKPVAGIDFSRRTEQKENGVGVRNVLSGFESRGVRRTDSKTDTGVETEGSARKRRASDIAERAKRVQRNRQPGRVIDKIDGRRQPLADAVLLEGTLSPIYRGQSTLADAVLVEGTVRSIGRRINTIPHADLIQTGQPDGRRDDGNFFLI